MNLHMHKAWAESVTLLIHMHENGDTNANFFCEYPILL